MYFSNKAFDVRHTVNIRGILALHKIYHLLKALALNEYTNLYIFTKKMWKFENWLYYFHWHNI